MAETILPTGDGEFKTGELTALGGGSVRRVPIEDEPVRTVTNTNQGDPTHYNNIPLVREGNSFTFNSNGVTVTISPHYRPVVTNALCTLMQDTVISFNRDVQEVIVRIYGINPGQLIGLDGNSNQVDSVFMDPDTVNGVTEYTLRHPQLRGVGVRGLNKFPLVGIVITPSNTTSAPITGVGGSPTQPVNLTGLVQLSRSQFSREYVKNSMAPIAADVVTLTNISSNVEIDVRLSGMVGVSFEPSMFKLLPNQSQNVNILFNVSDINSLVEGVTRVNCTIDLSSSTVLTVPVSAPLEVINPPIVDVPLLPPIVIVEPIINPPVIAAPEPPEPPIIEQPLIIEPPINSDGRTIIEEDDNIPTRVKDESKTGGIVGIIRRKFFDF